MLRQHFIFEIIVTAVLQLHPAVHSAQSMVYRGAGLVLSEPTLVLINSKLCHKNVILTTTLGILGIALPLTSSSVEYAALLLKAELETHV